MKIKKVEAKALKGKNFKYELGDVNIITGKNFAGKSAVTDAIRLGLLGYLPEHPKTNQGIFSLSSETEMSVSLELFDGLKISREWVEKGKSVSCKEEVPKGFPETPLVMMDAKDYLGRSDNERVKMMFDLLHIEELGITAESILSELNNISLASNTEAAEMVKKELHESLSKIPRNTSIQEWINVASAFLKEKSKDANASVKRMTQTIQGISQLKLNEEDTIINAPMLESKISQLRKEIETLIVSKAEIETKAKNAENQKKRIIELEKMIEAGREKSQELQSLEKKVLALSKNVEAYSSETPVLLLEKSNIEKEQNFIKDSLDSNRKELSKKSDEYEKVITLNECPCCGADGVDWKKKIKAQFKQYKKEWEEKNDASMSNLTSKIADKVKLDTKISEWKAKDNVHSQNKESLEKLNQQLKLAQIASNSIEIYKKELEIIKVTDDEGEEKLGQLVNELDKKRQELDKLEITSKRVQNFRSDEKRLAEAELESEKYKSSVEIIKEAIKLIADKQAQLIEKTFAPLLNKINMVTDSILESKIAYHNNEIGRFYGKSWIPVRCFSGAEQSITYAGIQAALGMTAPSKIIIIDELGRIDESNKIKLISNIQLAIEEGLIDQFIGIDLDAKFYPKDLTFIEV